MPFDDDALSFDDVSLEEEESSEETGKADEQQDTKEDTKDETTDDSGDSTETKKTEDSSQEEDATSEEDSKKEVKLVNFSKEDKTFELPVDAVIKHKVDGKEVEFTIQELLNDKAGQEHWDRKNTELNAREKEINFSQSTYKREEEAFVGKVNHFVESVNKKDIVGTMDALARLTGQNALDLRTHFVALMEDQAKIYWKLSDDERKQVDTDVKIKYYENRDKHRSDQDDASQEHAVLEKSIIAFQIKHKLDDTDLVALADQLKGKSIDLSLEALETEQKENVLQGKASQMLNQIDPTLKADKDYIAQVAKFIQQNPDLSDAEVSKSIKDAIKNLKSSDTDTKNDDKENSVDKLKKRISKNKTSSPSSKEGQDETDDLDDVVDFDEIVHD